MNKEQRRKKYKSMTSQERQELILKKMKAKGIEVGSGVPDKKSSVTFGIRKEESSLVA